MTANGQGRWSLAHADIRAGKDLTTLAIDTANNTSETSPRRRIQSSMEGTGANAGPSLARQPVPPAPARPPAYQPDLFTCSHGNGTLSWADEGAAEYYVRSVDAGGTETYLGSRTGTSSTVPDAAGYRVVNWARGFARSATCAGPGDPGGPPTFACSYGGGTLSWSDVGASTYYIRLVDGGGVERYFGSATGLSASVPAAASYLVIHWTGGTRNATGCAGPG